MSEQPKRIIMREVLAGFPGIYKPDWMTEFDVSLSVNNAEADGTVAWLKAQLPSWEKLLNEQSGARVVSSELKDGGQRWAMSSLMREVKIYLKLIIEGGMDLSAVTDTDTNKMFSGQIKKLLAQKILRDFSPPFDVEKPLFLANFKDYYWLCQYNGHIFFGEEDKKFISAHLEEIKRIFVTTSKTVSPIIKEIKLVERKFLWHSIKTEAYQIVIEWNRDQSNKIRTDLIFYLRKYFSDNYKSFKVTTFADGLAYR